METPGNSSCAEVIVATMAIRSKLSTKTKRRHIANLLLNDQDVTCTKMTVPARAVPKS